MLYQSSPLLACKVICFFTENPRFIYLFLGGDVRNTRDCPGCNNSHVALERVEKCPFSLFSMASSLVLFVFGHGVETSHHQPNLLRKEIGVNEDNSPKQAAGTFGISDKAKGASYKRSYDHHAQAYGLRWRGSSKQRIKKVQTTNRKSRLKWYCHFAERVAFLAFQNQMEGCPVYAPFSFHSHSFMMFHVYQSFFFLQSLALGITSSGSECNLVLRTASRSSCHMPP